MMRRTSEDAMATSDEGEAVSLRDEVSSDRAAIAAVITAAFGQPGEAALVDALRDAGALTLSLVAIAGGAIVGHVAFSPVTITREDGVRAAIGLAPVAVAPAWQGRGVGARLVSAGLERLRAAGAPAVLVLGHPRYYPRFGFAPASRFGLRWEQAAPDAAFMALELSPGALAGGAGVVRYRPEFSVVAR